MGTDTPGEDRNTTVPDRHLVNVPEDTATAVHRVQGEIYRKMGGPARLAVAFELSEATRRLTIAGIRARHPGYSDADVLHAWAVLMLGDDLAREIWPDRDVIQP